MVNYGNSKALVAVPDAQVPSTAGTLSSVPALNGGVQQRPVNPGAG